MSRMQYDKTEPLLAPTVISITLTIVAIFIISIVTIYMVKSEVSNQKNRNNMNYGVGLDLHNLREYELKTLSEQNDEKVTIDDAIYLIYRHYTR
jgi:hypothetical protein